MSDEVPERSRPNSAKPFLSLAQRIGEKCVVTEMEDRWHCAHGTDGEGQPSGVKDNAPDVSPKGSIGIDRRQARIYYRPPQEAKSGATNFGHDAASNLEPTMLMDGAKRAAVVWVVRPDDTPFRVSLKGVRKDRTKSFKADQTPSMEVLLLYALKTRRTTDRLRALDDLPSTAWSDFLYPSVTGSEIPYPTFGEIFQEIQDLAEDEHLYQLFVGRLMARAAQKDEGFSDWRLWESTAQAAAEETRSSIAKSSRRPLLDFDAMFLQAVRETTIEYEGLPSQLHVRNRWEELGGRGEWRANRRKLGFDWLPSIADWKKSWLPVIEAREG